MNRVTRRTWLIGIFIGILVGGLAFFLWEYATQAEDWVRFPGSPHLYNNNNLGCGTVEDRNGEMLLDIGDERSYSSDSDTRKSTLHWLGDRKGFIKAAAVANYSAAMAGYNKIDGIYSRDGSAGVASLTLSAKVQNAALEAMKGKKGVVAVYNYKTGEILCALTAPNYDPNDPPELGENPPEEYEGLYINRFVQSAYIPGSIFKIVTASAALENVPDILDRKFTCTGSVKYGEEKVTCEKSHGKQTLKEAFAHSCNCAFAQIAELVGKENMVKFVGQTGVTEPLSFDGITTAAGNYDISDTAPVSFAWSCIGQHTDLVNPARYLAFVGAVAGGGTGAQPHLVEQVRAGETVTYQAETVMSKQLLSPETAKIIGEYMRNNVKTVYGDENFSGLRVCAKSGTSQVGGGKTSNSMFAGFVADEQYPLAFFAAVENGGYGSKTCVPIIGKVLAQCKAVMDGE